MLQKLVTIGLLIVLLALVTHGFTDWRAFTDDSSLFASERGRSS